MGTSVLNWPLAGARTDQKFAGVAKTAAQTLTTGTNTTVAFTTAATAAFDADGLWSAADNAFVAPAAGYMQVWGGARWATVTSSTYRRIRPMKDGAVYLGGGGEGFLAPNSNSRCAQSFLAMPVPVVGGEKFTMQALHNRGSNLDIDANARTFFACRFIPAMQGVLLKLTANEAAADGSLFNVPWDAAEFDHLSAWSAGDPTKLTIPNWVEDNIWIYAGAHFSNLGGMIVANIDRNTGSRPGGTIQCLSTASGGGFDSYLTVASGLFRARYDGTEYGGEFGALETIPNAYKLQVAQDSAGAEDLIADGQSYLGCELVPGLGATRIRLAASQTIANSTDTTVSWGNDVDRDDYGIYNPATPTKIVLPAGYRFARIMVNLSWETDANFDRYLDIFKDGAACPFAGGKAIRAATSGDATRTHVCSIVPIDVAGGDEITVVVRQNSGGDLDILGGALANTAVFEITLFE